jgi:hypothetical protein
MTNHAARGHLHAGMKTGVVGLSTGVHARIIRHNRSY